MSCQRNKRWLPRHAFAACCVPFEIFAKPEIHNVCACCGGPVVAVLEVTDYLGTSAIFTQSELYPQPARFARSFLLRQPLSPFSVYAASSNLGQYWTPVTFPAFLACQLFGSTRRPRLFASRCRALNRENVVASRGHFRASALPSCFCSRSCCCPVPPAAA